MRMHCLFLLAAVAHGNAVSFRLHPASPPPPPPLALRKQLLSTARNLAHEAGEIASYLTAGALIGYVGMQAVFLALALPSVLVVDHGSRATAGPPTEPPRTSPGAALGSGGDTVAGHWVPDPAQSDSLEPFLVAVGVPRIVARLTGRWGRPLAIDVSSTGTVTVVVGRKAPEMLRLGETTAVST